MDNPKVFDQQGQEQNWDWLIDNFGAVNLERATPTEGSAYRIVKLQDAEGPSVQIVTVVDQDGNPIESVHVIRHWPDAPDLPAWSPPASMWRLTGVFGRTNINGDIGFGMGHGDYYFPPNGGASAVWIADEAGPSDFISGLGMLGGTNHRRVDVTYQLLPVAADDGDGNGDEDGGNGDNGDGDNGSGNGGNGTPPVLPDELWQQLFEKLDLIIDMLQTRIDNT